MNLFGSKLIERLTLTLLCILPLASVAYPARSAEQIKLSYHFLSGSIPLQSLETDVCAGQTDRQFINYACKIDSKQITQLQQVLSTKIPLNSVAVSQFLDTPIGENLLTRLGRIIQTEDGAGLDPLRSAMIRSARNPQGFTLLEVLRQVPAQTAHIKLEEALTSISEIDRLVNQTNAAIAAVDRKATSGSQSPFDASSEDLQQPGKLAWQKQTLTFNDPDRDRQLLTDLYLPRSKTRHPVVVISHGLGSDRFSYIYLAQHLASYGFAVVVLEHPGSNSQQLAALLTGKAKDIVSPQEFVDRPMDAIELLDKLEQLSRTDPNIRGRLNLQNVGIVGQSFGGYTALALAGATLQPQHLKAQCQSADNSLNLSLLLQCQATQLPQLPARLSDPRIKAAIAIAPFGSAIFGQTGLSQIEVPMMIVAGSADTLSPALPEQIQPFTWLTTPDKYLVLMTGATHFSTIGSSPNEAVPLPSSVKVDLALIHQYMNALGAAFFKAHLMKQDRYRSYLSADYTKSIGRSPVQLGLVKTLSTTDLSNNLGDKRRYVIWFVILCLVKIESLARNLQPAERASFP